MLKCTCAECGITKTRFVKKTGKLNSPSERAGGDLYNSIETKQKKYEINENIYQFSFQKQEDLLILEGTYA